MSKQAPHHPPQPREEIDSDTLRLVQAYLLARTERREPDRESTAAWLKFYAAYDPFIRRIAGTHCGSSTDLEDRVQEIWCMVVKKLPGLRFAPQRGQLSGWMATVARHVLADLHRRAAHHPLGHFGFAVEDHIPGREPEPPLACDFSQVRQGVRCALDELRPRVSEIAYQVVFLRWIEGKRIAEIAAALDLTPKQVRDQHQRTLIKLRKLLAKRVK